MHRTSRFYLLPLFATASLVFLPQSVPPALAADDTTLISDVNEPSKPQVELTKDIVYGTVAGEDLRLDLATPKGLTRPTAGVVWIHGGAWRGGDKREFERPLIESAQQGYVAVNINYRLVPKQVFPAQVEDCKCAIRWFRSHADQFHLDPKRIGVVGSSAGAHLAMMLGTLGSEDGLERDAGSPGVSSRVQAVVSFAGPTNLQSPFPDASKQLVADFLGHAA
ncbi:MAG TPA: alpha/beta hydrolase, partial [Pirellulales bacterium]|nr:alpha/beta hydrolase [Pirellulales bacterium]